VVPVALSSGTSVTCKPCPGCGLPWHGSEECKSEAGHKYMCGSPLSSETAEEYELHRKIFKNDIREADKVRGWGTKSEQGENNGDGQGMSKGMDTAEDDNNELEVVGVDSSTCHKDYMQHDGA
jgi:hypothetical protein